MRPYRGKSARKADILSVQRQKVWAARALKGALLTEKRKAAEKMHVSPFVSGIATGAVAGAVVSMVAAGAMLNPTVRRNAQHMARRAEHSVHKAAHNVGQMIG